MRIRNVGLLLIGLALVSAGCERSVTLLAPEVTIFTEVLTGTVSPPVNGELQKTSRLFTVGQTGGDVTVTLTSAVQTLLRGRVALPDCG